MVKDPFVKEYNQKAHKAIVCKRKQKLSSNVIVTVKKIHTYFDDKYITCGFTAFVRHNYSCLAKVFY